MDEIKGSGCDQFFELLAIGWQVVAGNGDRLSPEECFEERAEAIHGGSVAAFGTRWDPESLIVGVVKRLPHLFVASPRRAGSHCFSSQSV